jgi:RsiW-degrading membrane proteinase PrsW (M82 family)
MWKVLRVILCLAFFVPVFALLGAFATLDSGERAPWAGLLGGAVTGLLLGGGFAGFLPMYFASLFGPPARDEEHD